jgi:LPXTG-motif cell wall-anchored protein
VFTPVGSTNTFYLPAVAPGATADYQVRLQPRISADTRTYSLNATLEYEDEKGNKYTASQIVGVPVVQELKLTVADIQVPVQVFLFDRLTVSVDYYNMGRALVRNLMITTEGNFEITNGSRYIGNMEPGKSNYFDVMLTPSQLGRASGRVIFTFEDEIGNRYEQSRSFAFDVAERVEEENPDQFAPEAPSETNGSKLPLVGGAGVLLLLGGIFWLRRRRRKKAEEELAFDE